MCKGVETVDTVIWTHATVANTTKRQSVNCNTKSSLTAFNYILWCRFDTWNRWQKTDVKIKNPNTLSEYHIYPPTIIEILNVTKIFTEPINEILHSTKHINLPQISFLFWFLMWHYMYLTLYSANGKITDECSIGKDPERQDIAEMIYYSGIFL